MTLHELEELLEELRRSTTSSRVTARLDDSDHGWSVNDVTAEALAPGVASLKGMTSINQRAAETAQWIEATREPLVQDDVSIASPKPPAALLELYRVRAQMLAPIVVGDDMAGWLSVHDCAGPHRWSADERAFIRAAARAVERGWPVEAHRTEAGADTDGRE